MTELTFPDSLVITSDDYKNPEIKKSHLICPLPKCKKPLSQESKVDWLSLENAEWVEAHPGRMSVGYHIPQFYSMVIQPWEIAVTYLKGLENPADEQEFYNSKLGMTHTPKGAKIDDDQRAAEFIHSGNGIAYSIRSHIGRIIIV